MNSDTLDPLLGGASSLLRAASGSFPSCWFPPGPVTKTVKPERRQQPGSCLARSPLCFLAASGRLHGRFFI